MGIIGWVFGMAENYRLCGAVNSSQCFEGYVCARCERFDGQLELDPAALGHDIDRAVEERKVQRRDFADHDAFQAAHARKGAVILREIMHERRFPMP